MKFLLASSLAIVLWTAIVGAHHDSLQTSNHHLVQSAMLKQREHFQYLAENFETWTPRKRLDNINDFVDMVINEVRKSFADYNLDPMDLPFVEEDVDLSDSNVHVKLWNGTLRDTSSIFRNGEVLLTYKDRILHTTVPMFFKSLNLVYDYQFLVGEDQTPLIGNLTGNVIVVDVNFQIALNFKEMEIKLETLNITDIGAIDVQFKGGMHNVILQSITDYITKKFKSEVVGWAEYISRFAVNKVLSVISGILSGVKP